MLRDTGPVAGEHLAAERVDLDLPDDGHPGPLQAELQGADAGEQGEDVHGTLTAVVITEHLRPGQLDAELAKVTDRRDPPLPVVVFLLDDWWPAVLHGWARNPRGSEGWWGLCSGVREYAAGFGAEFCTWVAAEEIRRR